MPHAFSTIIVTTALSLCVVTSLFAQGVPAPGPTNPNPPPSAQPKMGKDLVVNPTDQECVQGWDPTMKWTKEAFNEFCATLRAAK